MFRLSTWTSVYKYTLMCLLICVYTEIKYKVYVTFIYIKHPFK